MKKWQFFCILLGMFFLPSFLAGCTSSTPGPDPSAYSVKTKNTADYFGTLSSLRLYGDFENISTAAALEDTWQAVKDLLAEIEAAVAVDLPHSDVACFNACGFGESVPIGPHTAAILTAARQVYNDTEGAYDPTVYPLVDLWGFTPRFTSGAYDPVLPYDREWENGALPLPDNAYIDAFCQLADFSGVTLSGSEEEGYTLTKNIPPVTVDGTEYQAQMDLGGIAKGYAVDKVLELLREEGWLYGYFSCGSSSMGFLEKPAGPEEGVPFRLGVRKPRQTEAEDTAYLTLDIADTCLSSSGDYEHSYHADGVLYCHIIDPRTGWPVNTPVAEGPQQGLTTVTALGGSAAYNDGLTTALCIMGPERAWTYVKEHLPDQKVILVSYRADRQIYPVLTNLEEGAFSLPDPAYVLTTP